MRLIFFPVNRTYNYMKYTLFLFRTNQHNYINAVSLHTSNLLNTQRINLWFNKYNDFPTLLNIKLPIFSQQYREKHNRNKKGKIKNEEYESDTESEDEDLQNIPKLPGIKVINIQCASLRCDLVLKNSLGIARNRLQHLFYESRLRINGKKIFKLHTSVNLGDEIDIVQDISSDNENHILVSRVEILKARPTGDFIMLTVKKEKSLLIENYPGTDKWEKQILPEETTE